MVGEDVALRLDPGIEPRLGSPRSAYHRRAAGGGKKDPMTSSNREPGLRRRRHKSSVASPHSSHDVSPRGQELAHLGKEKSEGRDLSFLALYSW